MAINIFMAFTVRCSTLFDITHTGIVSRRNTNTDPLWILKRNQQCNFDTVLQAISLRAQPENISTPIKKTLSFTNHNFCLEINKDVGTKINFWEFEFEINHTSVYKNSIDELGHLYNDCDKIPMIKCNTEWIYLPNYLDTGINTRNIYFEVINDVVR